MRRMILFVLSFLAVERFCYLQTQGFMVSKILSHLPSDPTWHLPPPTGQQKEELKQRLNQPFYFLGKGNECYAFVSEDETTVIKFFKHQLVRLPFAAEAWLSRSVVPFWTGLTHARDQRLRRSFISCKIAFEHFAQETGLIAVNLAKDWKLGMPITLIDQLGIRHTIDPDTTEFVIQHKATPAKERLSKLMQEKRHEDARAHLEAILHHIRLRREAGYDNRDIRPLDNFGFIGEQAVEIDIGSYLPKAQKNDCVYDLTLYKNQLIKYLETMAP